MTRDTIIADLEIHGWVPVRAIAIIVPGPGIWSAERGVGIRAVAAENFGKTYYDIRWVHRPDMEPCGWDELTDEVLGIVAPRLGVVV